MDSPKRYMKEKMYLCSMEKYAIILSILLTTYALQANAQSCSTAKEPLTATVVGELAPELGNTSALLYWNGGLWTCNDHGSLALHRLDTMTGETLQTVGCDTSFNDMEEVVQDSDYFYFGDFGNNHEQLRGDLRILRLRKSDLTQGFCRFDTIAFTYSGYDPGGEGAGRLPSTDYDCEAMVAVGDSLYLFTKQWTSQQTTCFALPKEPGTYTALPRFSIDIEGMVTGACHLVFPSPEGTKQVLALCGYNLFVQPFVFLVYGFNGNAVNEGLQIKLPLDNPMGTQTEAIASSDGLHYWLTNESFNHFGINQPAQLLRLDLSDYLSDYLHPDSTQSQGLSPVSIDDGGITVHPNPTDGVVTIDHASVEKVEVLDSTGRLLLQSDDSRTLDLQELDAGTYLLRITTRQGSVISRKVVRQ